MLDSESEGQPVNSSEDELSRADQSPRVVTVEQACASIRTESTMFGHPPVMCTSNSGPDTL